ncbi:MAG: hypothetical protein COA78_35700 [Blastopirellula sp.]|nr:MAG: hypothetical protein COA78_35700 [Blastopirellula sp.]
MMSPSATPVANLKLSVIVAALNEEDLIANFVQELIHELDINKINWEIVLVNDGSIDNTGQIIEDIAQPHEHIITVHNQSNIGLGKSYRKGVDTASGTHVILMCGDGGLPASNLSRLIPYFGKYDIIIPVISNLKNIKTPARLVLSKIYKLILNTIFRLDIGYYNGGSLHRRDLVRQVNLETSGFGFQAELLVKLIRSGVSYTQVEVVGAELSQKSAAITPRNFASVLRTFYRLIVSIFTHKKIDILLENSK